MFGKVGLAALAMVPVFGATHTGDLRDLYNQMYPVNAMTRDAFGLCHESDATFIRALAGDREHCLDHMPHSIALAIGRARPDGDLLAWAPISDGDRAALRLAQAPAAPARPLTEMPRGLATFVDVRKVSASPASPLAGAIGLAGQTGSPIDDLALARLVLVQHGVDAEASAEPLPLVPPATAGSGSGGA